MSGLTGRELQLATTTFVVEVNGHTFTFDTYQGIQAETGRSHNHVKDKNGTNVAYTVGDEDTGSPQLSGVLLSEWETHVAWLATVAPGVLPTAVIWQGQITMGESPNQYTRKIQDARWLKDPLQFGADQNAPRSDLPFAAKHITRASGSFA